MPVVEYIGTTVLDDNSLELFDLIFSILYYSDPEYKLKIIYKKDDEIIGHITPSKKECKQPIIDNLLHINRHIKTLRVRYSSSLAISKIISFRIPLQKSK